MNDAGLNTVWHDLWLTLMLQGGSASRWVLVAATLLGASCGIVGTFAVLRKRAMMSDALSHATLPGIATAYLAWTALGRDGRSLPVLLLGAALSGVLGVLATQAIIRFSRLREDAAIGAVLSVFFGIGVVLMSVIQSLSTGTQGGLHHFILGQAAAMTREDAQLIAIAGGAAVLIATLLHKEFRLVTFDGAFAQVQGWPVSLIDLVMMALVVIVTVVGLQAVGVVLIVALLVIPAAAARLWTDRLGRMLAIAAFIGGVSAYVGVAISAVAHNTPTGAAIVLCAGAAFGVSLLFAPRRGLLARSLDLARLRLRIACEHALDAMLEHADGRYDSHDIARSVRSPLARVLLPHSLRRWGWARQTSNGLVLSDAGRARAKAQRDAIAAWHGYLDVTGAAHPGGGRPSADAVEHVLSPRMVEEILRATAKVSELPSGGASRERAAP